MNIKFNFYDIYGFALPGFLLVALLWLPVGLIQKNWPDPQFSSALIGVILVYIAGHVMQTVAHHVIPSRLSNGRNPSSVVLDRGNPTFTDEVKENLKKKICTAFGLDVSLDLPANATDAERKEVDAVRDDALFLCRSALIKSKTVIYAEQFQGLYALMRGLCAAFAVAVAYYLGWAYSSLWLARWSGLFVLAGIIGATITFMTGKRGKPVRWMISGFLLLAAFAIGHYLGQSIVGTPEHRNQFLAASVVSFFAAERCYAGYKAFAQEFVKAVYRDFYLYEGTSGGDNGSKDANESNTASDSGERSSADSGA